MYGVTFPLAVVTDEADFKPEQFKPNRVVLSLRIVVIVQPVSTMKWTGFGS